MPYLDIYIISLWDNVVNGGFYENKRAEISDKIPDKNRQNFQFCRFFLFLANFARENTFFRFFIYNFPLFREKYSGDVYERSQIKYYCGHYLRFGAGNSVSVSLQMVGKQLFHRFFHVGKRISLGAHEAALLPHADILFIP